MKRPRKLADGELSNPSRLRKNGTYVHLIKCCDCGLQHLLSYQITGRGLQFRAWRMNHKRRHKNGAA